jgi:hypothetical protein
MKHKKDWGPGYRYFKCEECGHEWREPSRDCTSMSGEPCSNEECTDIFCSLIMPHKIEPHYEWPTDPFGNLLRDHKYE